MKRPILLTSLAFALACATAPEQPAQPPVADASAGAEEEVEGTPIPLDPAVRTGTLDNGLTYFIRKHEQPKQRAMLWLAVDAGSVLEDDDQRGLAHFVEHMAFNGTERFAKNTLIDFIEKAGMDFGADLNAYTSFDETVYMLTVPTDDGKLVTLGLDVLEDWAGALSFDPAEVDKERGVVIEEWRLGRGAGQRAFDKQWPIFLAGSKYADRKPIGEKEILEKAPVDTLRRYYKDWYRPDLMAVIVVGDVDPDQMQKEIEKRFGDLKQPDTPRPRENIEVPLAERTRAAIVTDDETSFGQVSVAIKGPLTPVRTEEEFRDELVEDLFHEMLRARLGELRRKPDAPYVFAFTSTSAMGRAVDVFRLFAGAKPGQADKVLEVLTTEVERVHRHGFVPTEFQRAQADLLRQLERAVTEEAKAESRSYAFGLARHFLDDEALPSRSKRLELAKKFLPGITLDEVNALAGKWTARKDRVVMASGAARDKMPSEKEMLAIVDEVSKRDVQPYTDTVGSGTLMASKPEPGSVAKEEQLEKIGVTVWTLGNGVRVVVKPTDFKNDEVRMYAWSPGGTSLVPTKRYRTAASAGAIVGQAGLGEHDATAIEKMMAGKVAWVRPFIDELEEGLRGNASPQDLETMMQMIHLRFTAPRKDPEAFQAWRGQQEAFVKNRDLDPMSTFFEKLTAFSNNDHPRRKFVTMPELEKVDFDAAFDFYGERFADAGDFTFVFVGNVDVARMKDLSTKYLASLPSKGRKESWKDPRISHPKGVKSFELRKGQDPKSFVYITYHGTAKWSPEAEDDLDMLAEVLDIRLREVLREEMSGVYGAFSRGSIERRPKQRYTYSIGFGCAPENVEKLERAVHDEITKIKQAGIGDDYVEKLKEQRRRKLETDRRRNDYWERQLAKHFRYGTDASAILELEEKAIERVNSDNVRKAARRYLGNQRIEGVLVPEKQ
jgi:zinc protease